jgi:hypothetical protein
MQRLSGRLGAKATATPTSDKPESAGRTWLRRGVITVLVLGAIGMFILAGTLADTDSPENAAITDGVVEALTPLEDSSVVQQSRVTLDLASGWTGNLTINGIAIPEEQTLRNPALNLVEYQPLDDQVIEQLQAGRNCANAVVWPIAEGPDGASQRTVVWCWEVV